MAFWTLVPPVGCPTDIKPDHRISGNGGPALAKLPDAPAAAGQGAGSNRSIPARAISSAKFLAPVFRMIEAR